MRLGITSGYITPSTMVVRMIIAKLPATGFATHPPIIMYLHCFVTMAQTAAQLTPTTLAKTTLLDP